jgi:acetyl esterase/lipase
MKIKQTRVPRVKKKCFNIKISLKNLSKQCLGVVLLGLAAFSASLSYFSPTAFASNQGPVICPTPNCGAPTTSYAIMPTWTDLPYAVVSPSEMLDLYTPFGTGPFPTIVYVHGGGWRNSEDKSLPKNQGIVAQAVADGYAVASVNYRLSGEATFPAAIRDVKAAVRWLRANATTCNLDPNKFAAWGNSAGGELASLLGTSCNDSYLEGNLGNASQSSCVQAVVDWYGPNDFILMDPEFNDLVTNYGLSCPSYPATHHLSTSAESEYISDTGDSILQHPGAVKAANPITYVSGDEPPFFIQHGTADCTVPYVQSQLLNDALVQKIDPANVSLQFLDGYVHGDSRFTSSSNLSLVLQFLDKYLK